MWRRVTCAAQAARGGCLEFLALRGLRPGAEEVSPGDGRLMRVFRSTIGSWCGLLALAAQLALSFAHVHYSGIRGCPASAILNAANRENPACDRTSSSIRLRLTADAPSATLPAAPAQPTGHLLDACVICALINLTSPAVAAPALPLPGVDGQALLHAGVERRLMAWPHRLFQARAPPLA